MDITGFMARFDLVNATLAGVGSLTAALVLRTVSKSRMLSAANTPLLDLPLKIFRPVTFLGLNLGHIPRGPVVAMHS